MPKSSVNCPSASCRTTQGSTAALIREFFMPRCATFDDNSVPLGQGRLQGGFECRNKPTPALRDRCQSAPPLQRRGFSRGDCHNPVPSHHSVLTLRLRNFAPVIAARANPLIGVGSLRPGLPARRQVFDNLRVTFCQTVELRAVRLQIIQLPPVHVLRNELPFTEAD